MGVGMTAGFLLDTVVLSAAAPARGIAHDPAKQAARAWIMANKAAIFLPVTAVAEIAAGIGEREAAGATRHAADLAAWLRSVLNAYPERVLPFGPEAALHARALVRTARAAGHRPGFADLTVACIAAANDLTVVTRNVRDFAPLGVPVLDPFVMA